MAPETRPQRLVTVCVAFAFILVNIAMAMTRCLALYYIHLLWHSIDFECYMCRIEKNLVAGECYAIVGNKY